MESQRHLLNCRLVDGEKPHPSNYGICSFARKELLPRNVHKRAANNPPGLMFSSGYGTQDTSFAVVVRCDT
jgi:hypothetical protein